MSFSHRFCFFRLLLAPCFLLLTGWVHAADLGPAETLFVDLSQQPDQRSLAAFDLCVLHPHAVADMEPGHARGARYLALLDVAQVRLGTREAVLAAARSVPSIPHVMNGQMRQVDCNAPNWIAWMVEAQIDPAARRGFDGFVLRLGDMKADAGYRRALLTLAATVRQRYPDKALLLDFSAGLDASASHVADGFLALGVFTHAGRAGSVEWTPVVETQKIARRIRAVQMQGMRVFAVDYAMQGDRAAAREAAQRLAVIGARPFITTPGLKGVNLGPLVEISRRVLVLHGWDERRAGRAAPEADVTATARILQEPLEWLGRDLDFRLARGLRFLPEDHDFSAVILDPSLCLDAEQQRVLAAWLPSLAARGIPLLLTGMPFTDEAARHLALRQFEIGGSAEIVPRLAKADIASLDRQFLTSKMPLVARALGFLDLAAPPAARIVLALRGADSLGHEHRFDQVFLTHWGAACLGSFELTAAQIDLPTFLASWLGESAMPVPDTTTREGRRVFYSHVSSVGFSSASTLPGFPLCAEVMRDRILNRYLLPVTVSVCEADLRGWLPGQQAGNETLLEHVARSIFELPQVQAASNSFSRPKHWGAGSEITSRLNERAQSARRDMEREIAGSMAYIHRRLLPVGKEVNLMLWPGDAKPSTEALRFCETLQIAQLSDGTHTAVGDCTVSSLSDDSTRTRPVALRCSFEDAHDSRGIAALEKAFDVCAGLPLHAMTAAAYAASVNDARATRILRVSDQHWIIINRGDCRTLRLPISAGVPDMAKCEGVSGYTTHSGQLYIHTLGRERTEIVLTSSQQPSRLHLVESSAQVEFMEITSRRAIFQVRSLRPVEMVFGGFEPHGQCSYLENGRPYTATANAEGRVHLDIACSATVSLQMQPPALRAAMR